jgi:hypothetical protein
LAVLPLRESLLFRAERGQLRIELAAIVARHATSHRVLPLADVDTQLRPRSKAGARCAFEHAPWEQKAKDENWRFTTITHVLGGRDTPEELWVEVRDRARTDLVLSALWNPKLPQVERYRSAFAAMAPKPGMAGILGGLGISGRRRDSVQAGELNLCETRDYFACSKNTAKLADVAPQMSTCFAGSDVANASLVLEGAGCEISGLDDIEGPEGQRERCLCKAVRSSSGFAPTSGRRRIMLSYEAADLAGKPRPELRIVETSTNMRPQVDWHPVTSNQDGKVTRTSVRRLAVDNVDALAAPLSRCAAPPKSLAVVELEVTESGQVGAATVLDGVGDKKLKSCIEAALRHGAFDCTDGGKPGRMRLTLAWPE